MVESRSGFAAAGGIEVQWDEASSSVSLPDFGRDLAEVAYLFEEQGVLGAWEPDRELGVGVRRGVMVDW